MVFHLEKMMTIELRYITSSWEQFTSVLMRWLLIVSQLVRDAKFNLDDLDNKSINEGRLMYPENLNLRKKNMDDFIESYQTLFEEHSKK